MSRRTRRILLVVLIVADAWMAVTIINALARSGGEGAVFWSAVVLLAVITIGLLWATVRIARTRSRP